MNEHERTVFHNIGYFLSMKDLMKGVQTLSKEERVLFVVYQFECEKLDGGIDQYLGYSAGTYANEVLSSMKAIEANGAIQILKTWFDLFPDQISLDRWARQSWLRELCKDPEYQKLLKVVTYEYWKLEDPIDHLLCQNFESHREAFDPFDFDVPHNLLDFDL